MGRRHPSDIQDGRLLAILDKYLPPIIGRSIVDRARREAISGPDVSWTDPNGLLDRISVGVRLFAGPDQQAAILRDITDLAVAEHDEAAAPPRVDGAPASSMKPSSSSAGRTREEPPTRREPALGPPPAAGVPGKPSWTSAAPAPPGSSAAQPGSSSGSGTHAGTFTSHSGPVVAHAGTFTSHAGVTSYSAGLPPASPIGSGTAPAGGAASGSAPSATAAPHADPHPAPRRDLDAGLPPSRRGAEGPQVSRGVFSTSGPRPPAAAPGSTAGGPSPGRLEVVRAPAGATPAIPPPPGPRGTGTPPAGMPRVPAAVGPRPYAPGGMPRAPGRIEITHTGVPRAPGLPSRDIGMALPRGQQGDAGLKEVTITLATEHDIPLARQVAREICEHLGTRALTQQRLLTIVSELGRNMVLYAGGGKMTLRPPTVKSRRIVVVAVDQGPGIPNLPEIMAGKYKSRSGLGLGLLGTKRLADSFNVETGRSGTTVSVEVIL